MKCGKYRMAHGNFDHALIVLGKMWERCGQQSGPLLITPFVERVV